MKFSTRVKYQFHQGFFLPDQRSGNPNHPSPPYMVITGDMSTIGTVGYMNPNLNCVKYYTEVNNFITSKMPLFSFMVDIRYKSKLDFRIGGSQGDVSEEPVT